MVLFTATIARRAQECRDEKQFRFRRKAHLQLAELRSTVPLLCNLSCLLWALADRNFGNVWLPSSTSVFSPY